jgi:glycosyltransferase involved in cell wall biosynthesis
MALEKQKVEYDLIDQADETWVVSEFEKEVLSGERPDRSIEVVSNIVDAPGSATPFSLRHDFLFIGSFQHTPNVDAVIFFLSEIFPLIRARLPEARFYVIGDKVPPAVVALANENVIVTGFQPDVRPYFDAVKLSIAPLRWGAGVKGKINQSMGFGVPVVATSVAVEGMALTNRQDVLIADTAEEFACAVVELYQSEDLWTRISEKGLETTQTRYSSETARKQLSRLLNDDHFFSSKSESCGSESIASPRRSPDSLRTGVAR